MHDPFHVFHHHDGIVHQQADGQHHAKHGEGIDGVAESGQDREGPQQHHGDCQGGDQGGPEILQK